MRMCGDNSRKWLLEKTLITTPEFSLFITGIVPHGVEGLVLGAEDAMGLYSHFPGLRWKMHSGQNISDAWAPLPDLCLRSLSGLLNHENKFA